MLQLSKGIISLEIYSILHKCLYIRINIRFLMRINIKQLECKKCGYKWTPRQSEIRQCPKCKSAWWDISKVINQKG